MDEQPCRRGSNLGTGTSGFLEVRLDDPLGCIPSWSARLVWNGGESRDGPLWGELPPPTWRYFTTLLLLGVEAPFLAPAPRNWLELSPSRCLLLSFFVFASEAVGLLNGVGNEDVLLSCWRGDCFRACFTVGDRLTSARGGLGLSLIFFLLSVGDRDLE